MSYISEAVRRAPKIKLWYELVRITLQGALGDAEASGGCDKKGGSPHLGHLLSFLCVFFFLS